MARTLRRRTRSGSGTEARSPREESLLRSASGALVWSFVNAAAARLGTLAIGIVLARLLGPEEFGTYAVAYLALTAVLSFNELGVSLAIVRWSGDPASIAPTVTTLSVASSVLVTMVGWTVAPAFAAATGSPQATPVVRLLVLSVVVSGLVATPAALLQRQFKQRTKMLIDQVNTWLGAVVSIGLATYGMGAMSLAIGRLLGTVVAGVMFVAMSPLPVRFGFDKARASALLAFGLPLAGASIVVFAVGYLDQFVVGNLLGTTALGFYVLAFNLSSWPVNMFSLPLRSVAPAAFARLQHDPEAMNNGFRSVLGILAAATMPICLVLAGASEPIIRLVYGAEWVGAAPVLAWLGALAALRILFELVYDFLVVLGSSRRVFSLQVVWLIALVPALPAGAELLDAPGVAVAQFIVAVVIVAPLFALSLRSFGISVRDCTVRLVVPAAAATAAGAGAWLMARELTTLLAALLSGVLAVSVAAALLYRERSAIAAVREVSAGADAVAVHEPDRTPPVETR